MGTAGASTGTGMETVTTTGAGGVVSTSKPTCTRCQTRPSRLTDPFYALFSIVTRAPSSVASNLSSAANGAGSTASSAVTSLVSLNAAVIEIGLSRAAILGAAVLVGAAMVI